MKNTKKNLRIIAVALISLMLFCSVPGAFAEGSEPTLEKRIADQQRAVAANEALMQYFFDNGWIQKYPAYFGGCYIEDNLFYVKLISPTEQTKKILNEVLAGYEDVVVFEQGQYSEEELQAYADATATELRESGYSVTHWYVDSTESKIVIGVLPEEMTFVKKTVQEKQQKERGKLRPSVVIEAGAYGETTSAISVIGGSILTTNSGSRSVGVCGYDGGYNSLITCGHGNTQV